MPTSQTETTQQPKLLRIVMEYADGSTDSLESLPNEDMPLYSMRSKHQGSRGRGGAFSGGGIAAFLFLVAMGRQRIEYSAIDPCTTAALMRAFENPKMVAGIGNQEHSD